MVYHFKVHKEGKGYWAECIEIDSINTQGDTREELEANAHEALNLHLAEPDEDIVFAKPSARTPKGANIIAVPVVPTIAFALQLRFLREKRKMTQRQAATATGFANLSAYQRLESPKNANPELKTLARLKRAFPEMEIDQLFAED